MADQSVEEQLVLRQHFYAAQETLSFTDNDLKLMGTLAAMTATAVDARFAAELTAGRILGACAGAAAGYKLGKQVSRQLAKGLSGRFVSLFAKQAVRSGVGKSVGAGTGAVAGAKVGLACGPLAWVCSSVGAVAGAAAGWLAAASAIVTLNEAINRDSYRADLVKTVDAGKAAIKQQLSEAPDNAFNETSACITDTFERLSCGEALVAHIGISGCEPAQF